MMVKKHMTFLRFLHTCYRACFSPFFGNCCRFYPSCSEYAVQACEQHGFLCGAGLAVKRIFRCHPFSEGGIDEVPVHKK